MHRCYILTCIVAFSLLGSNAQAGFIINFAQVGNDVVATGAGSANLSGLSFLFNLSGSQINVSASSGNFRGGATGVDFSVYSGLTIPPTGFGSDSVGFGPGNASNNFPSFSSGDYFGLTAFNGRLFLPEGYVSGTQLSNTTKWNNRTLANLGLAPVGSTFVYTWGSGANADSLTVNITTAAVPEPSSMVLLLAGTTLMGGFEFLRRRGSRKTSQASQAV